MGGQQCVGAMLVQGGTLLLGKRTATRAFYPDVWDVFGGHIEVGESPEAALIRELQEELGITPTTFARYTPWRTDGLQAQGLQAYYLYVVTAWTGDPSNRQPDEHAEIAWLTLAQLSSVPLALDEYRPVFATLLPP